MRLPKHIGIIPDGNRRWAVGQGLKKEQGYGSGISPGMQLYRTCRTLGIEEMSFYGFTVDNTKRPSTQRLAFTRACVKAVEVLSKEDARLLVLGNTDSAMFPRELLPYTTRQTFGSGGMKINFLVNYSWEWDLGLTGRGIALTPNGAETGPAPNDIRIGPTLQSAEVSRVDLVIRWGGRRRLSGFLPVQSAYSDFYVLDEFWPDFKEEHIHQALEWYSKQDITLGG